MRPKYTEQIKKRIENAEPGSVFIPSDFFDIAEAVKVNVGLSRLVDIGMLDKVKRGVYAKPRFSDFLNTNIPPHSDSIAKAIARNYGWSVVPCGDTALNILGLSAQVPSVWSYISDGPYKTYNIDGLTFKFKHTDNKNEIISVSYKTALIIQAIKAIGKGNLSDGNLKRLSAMLDNEEKQKLLAESKRITAWVHDYIRQICLEESNEQYS